MNVIARGRLAFYTNPSKFERPAHVRFVAPRRVPSGARILPDLRVFE